MDEQKKPAISVVVPVYNGAEFLSATLDSIFQQTFQNFELICVDDGSNDQTPAILREYQKRYSGQLKIISQRNSGPGVARNNGIKQARGQYLVMLDADDLFEPNMFEIAYRKIVADQGDLVVFRSNEYISDEGRYLSTDFTINRALLPKREPFAGHEIKRDIFGAFIGWPWDKIYRTDFVRANQLKFQDLYSSEDALFVFMSIVRAERISTLDDVLVHHRRVTSSVSHTRETNWDSFYKALQAMREQLYTWQVYERYEQDFVNYALNFSLWHLMTLSGEAYLQLFDKLKTSWWKELGILGKGEEYFYNAKEYELYTQVLECTPCEFQYFLRMKTERELSLRDQRLEQIEHTPTWRIGSFMLTPVRVLKRILLKMQSSHRG